MWAAVSLPGHRAQAVGVEQRETEHARRTSDQSRFAGAVYMLVTCSRIPARKHVGTQGALDKSATLYGHGVPPDMSDVDVVSLNIKFDVGVASAGLLVLALCRKY